MGALVNSWWNLRVMMTTMLTTILKTIVTVLALGICGCSTSSQNQINKSTPVDRSSGLLDRRVATAGVADIPANVILKAVVTYNSAGISGECLILKGGQVTVSSGGGVSRTKNIQATLRDGKRPDPRQGNSQQRTANRQSRSREEGKTSIIYSEPELVELINLAKGGDLKDLQGETEDDDKVYSSIEIVAWVSEPGPTSVPRFIFTQSSKGAQKMNSQLTEEQVGRITSLTRSVCH